MRSTRSDEDGVTYAYGPPPYAPQQPQPRQQPSNSLATSGFIVAPIGAVLALIPLLGVVAWVISPVGLILSVVGLVLASSRLGAGRGLATQGHGPRRGGLVDLFAVGGGVPRVRRHPRWGWVDGATALAAPRVTSSAAAAESSTAPAEPTGSFDDGTYLVGEELPPGRYRTAGADEDDFFPYCSAQRKRDDGTRIGFPETTNTGPAFITVRESDGQVEFVGGCTWTLTP